MLERVASAASPVRILCAALALCAGAYAGRLVSTIHSPAIADTARDDACLHAVPDDSPPRTPIRTRSPGLNHRFLTRDVVAPRALRQYQL